MFRMTRPTPNSSNEDNELEGQLDTGGSLVVASTCAYKHSGRIMPLVVYDPQDEQDCSTDALPFVIRAESFQDRIRRYTSLFTVRKNQMEDICRNLVAEIELGCRLHADGNTSHGHTRCSLQMLDTFVSRLPTGGESGIAYGLDFANTCITAVCARLSGDGSIAWQEEKTNIVAEPSIYPRGLLDRECPAMELFDAVAKVMCRCLKKHKKDMSVPSIGFTMAFPLELLGEKSARLVTWVKGFETGRSTDDPAEGLDVVSLLEMAMWRQQVLCQVERVANDTVAVLMAGAYEKPAHLPPCAAALVVGSGFNGSYVDPNAEHYKYQGTVINTELGHFDHANMATDIDKEILFHECNNKGFSSLELMAGGGMLGEICRRLVLRVWRGHSPPAAWNPRSMPTLAALLCVTDESESLEDIYRLMRVLWDWDLDFSGRQVLKVMFSLVFQRSAAISAAAIASLARRTGRLSSQMGGLTVALEATPHSQHPWFQSQLTRHLRLLLGPDLSRLIHLLVVPDGTKKGAALLGWSQS